MAEGRFVYCYVICVVVTVLVFLFILYPIVVDSGENTRYKPPEIKQSWSKEFQDPIVSQEDSAGGGDGVDTQVNRSGSSSASSTEMSSQPSFTPGSSTSGFVSFDNDTSYNKVDTSNFSPIKLSQIVASMEQTLNNMTFISDLTFSEGFKLTFSPSYKNPCFEEEKRLWCLPYFFIGGFPKCGSTELFAKLINHPQIFKGKKKEMNWWTRFRYLESKKDFDFYKNLFKRYLHTIQTRVSENGYHPLILTDGSASTVWDNSHLFSTNSYDIPPHLNIHAIHSVLPDAKFVLILRNPITRLYSDYLYFQKKYSPENFHSQVVQTLEMFNECLADEEKPFLYCIYAPAPSYAPPLYWRMRIALYYVHLKVVLSVYPRSNIFILQLENYMQDEVTWLQRVMRFLDVTIMTEEDIAAIIKKRKATNSNKKAYKKSGPMLDKTRILLEEFYKPFNVELKALLGDGYIEY